MKFQIVIYLYMLEENPMQWVDDALKESGQQEYESN